MGSKSLDRVGRCIAVTYEIKADMIKKIFAVIFILLLSIPAFADTELTFNWSPNSEEDQVTEYWLYARLEDSTDFDIVKIPATDLSDQAMPSYAQTFPDGIWYFSLAAKNNCCLSSRTNEIRSYLMPPDTPSGLKISFRVTSETDKE